MPLRKLILCASLAALAIGPGLTQAEKKQARDKPSKKEMRKADAKFKLGIKLVEQKSYQEALAAFEDAYELAPHPLVLFNIAGAHRHLKNYREALNTYSRFLLEGESSVDTKLLKRGKRDMDELLSLVARVQVNSSPDGATLQLDGEEMGTTPLTERMILAPGEYQLEARLEGHKPLQRALRVSAGDELDLKLELESTAAAPTAPTSSVATGTSSTPESTSFRRLSLSAAFGTNTLQIADTGAPTLGVAYALSDRISLGVDAVIIAYSVIPQLRVRLFGDVFSMHMIAAAPLSFANGDEREFFAAGAAGAGLRYAISEAVALRVEALVSYAGSERGLTLPAFAGGEFRFF
jgi:tetratricopeptide (TPR) repeat protein